MDRLEQHFQQMRIFDGVTNWYDIDVCAPHSPISMILIFDDHDLDKRYQVDYDNSITYERVLHAYDDLEIVDLGTIISLED